MPPLGYRDYEGREELPTYSLIESRACLAARKIIENVLAKGMDQKRNMGFWASLDFGGVQYYDVLEESLSESGRSQLAQDLCDTLDLIQAAVGYDDSY